MNRILRRSLCTFLAASTLAIAPSSQFETTYSRLRDHDHYSMVDSADGIGHVLAGTLFDPANADATDVHVQHVDETGNTIWERIYDSGGNERALSLEQTPYGYIITGFVEVGGVNRLYLLHIDFLGSVIFEEAFGTADPSEHLQGLHALHTPVDDGFIVAGFSCTGFNAADDKEAFLLKTGPTGGLSWDRYYDSVDWGDDWDMGATVEIVPGLGYFLSGSVNGPRLDQFGFPNGTLQSVLALMVSNAGAIIWESSYFSQNLFGANDREVGADAYYDGNGRIYLLSNNTEAHLCAMTVLDSITGFIVDHWEWGPQGVNYIGLELLEAGDPNNLVLSGMVRQASFTIPDPETGVPTPFSGNTVPFLQEFDRTGGVIWTWLYPVPSAGFVNHGGYFGMFAGGQQPWILTPPNAARTDDGQYVLATYRTNFSPFIDLEVIKVTDKGENPCNDMPLNLFTSQSQRFLVGGVVDDTDTLPVTVGTTHPSLPCQLGDCGLPVLKEPCDFKPAFTWTANGCTVDFTGINGGPSTPVAWLWDFGDGNTGTGPNPTHTYATPGSYTVCLTLTGFDAAGDPCDETWCDDVFVECDSTDPCDFKPSFTWTANGCTLSFTGFNFGSSTPTTWFWDFGDGNTATGPTATHTYAASGAYTVCLILMGFDANGDPCEKFFCRDIFVECDECPCDVSASIGAMWVGKNVLQLQANTTTNDCTTVIGYSWDFGNGQTGTGNPVKAKYKGKGKWTVCLTVTATNGTTICTTTVYKTIKKAGIAASGRPTPVKSL